MIADYVPPAPPNAPRPAAVKLCDVCGHTIKAKHIEASGYGDTRPWCFDCDDCRAR